MTPGLRMPSGSQQPLELAHHRRTARRRTGGGRTGAIDAAGAVLGLERAARAEHEVDEVVGERPVPLEPVRAVEAVGEHEVDVAVLGVAEDHAVVVAVAVEQPGQRGRRCRAAGRTGHRDVLEQGAWYPAGRAAGHRGVEALADAATARPAGGVLAERAPDRPWAGRGARPRRWPPARSRQRLGRWAPGTPRAGPRARREVASRQQRRRRAGRGGRPAARWRRAARRSSAVTRAASGSAPVAAAEVGEDQQPGQRVGVQRDGAEGRLARRRRACPRCRPPAG